MRQGATFMTTHSCWAGFAGCPLSANYRYRPIRLRSLPSLEELQLDLDDWLAYYNNDRTHQGKMCCGRTPMQTLIDGKEAWRDKIITLNS
jgi:hypothetical protein